MRRGRAPDAAIVNTQLPQGAVGIDLGVRMFRKDAPEFANPWTLGIVTWDLSTHGPREVSRHLFERERFDEAHRVLISEDRPIVGYNLFDYDFRSLSAKMSLSELVGRSVDPYLLVFEKLDSERAEQGERASVAGLSLGTLAWANCGATQRPPGERTELEDAELVLRLWWKMLTTGEVWARGKLWRLSAGELALLAGQTARFASYNAWTRELLDREGLTVGRRHRAALRSLMAKRYAG